MAFRTRATRCVTRLIPLYRLTTRQRAQCEALHREAGRCWSDLVTAHKAARKQGQWMSVRELELLKLRSLHAPRRQWSRQQLCALHAAYGGVRVEAVMFACPIAVDVRTLEKKAQCPAVITKAP